MSNQELKDKNLNLKSHVVLFGLQCLIILGLSGCATVEYVAGFIRSEPEPHNEQIYGGYDAITLKESSSADVLTMYAPEFELLSQSRSVLASQGQTKKGYKNWLSMVTFDEKNLLAKRKYLLLTDEKPKVIAWMRANLSFDCQMALEYDIFEEPYASENAKRVAVLKRVLENSREDIKQISSDNKMSEACGALINQALEAVIVTLDSSPALAAKLSEPTGMEFSHMTFNKGKAGMLIDNNIVAVRIRAGTLTKHFENVTYDSLP